MKADRPKKVRTMREYYWILIFGDWVPARKLLDGWESKLKLGSQDLKD